MPKKVVTVTGDKALHDAFKRLSNVAKRSALLTAAKAGILPIQNDAVDHAPYKSGNLKRSIHTEVLEESNTSVMVATGTDVEYARRLEYGYSDIDALGRMYHQPAQPYMRPAYDNQRQAAIDEVKAVLTELILKEAEG